MLQNVWLLEIFWPMFVTEVKLLRWSYGGSILWIPTFSLWKFCGRFLVDKTVLMWVYVWILKIPLADYATSTPYSSHHSPGYALDGTR